MFQGAYCHCQVVTPAYNNTNLSGLVNVDRIVERVRNLTGGH